MYLIIAGAGVTGETLAASLIAAGHEVYIIETDGALVAKVRRELGSIVGLGYPASIEVLEQAGAARASVFVAVTPRDEDNLAACLLAKHALKVPRTVAIANQPDNAALMEAVGVDVAVSSVDMLLAALAGALPAHPLLRLMPVSSRTREIVGLKVPGRSVVVGRPLGDVPLPYGTQILIVIRSDGRIVQPAQDVRFESEDEVIALLAPDSAEALWETLTEPR